MLTSLHRIHGDEGKLKAINPVKNCFRKRLTTKNIICEGIDGGGGGGGGRRRGPTKYDCSVSNYIAKMAMHILVRVKAYTFHSFIPILVIKILKRFQNS